MNDGGALQTDDAHRPFLRFSSFPVFPNRRQDSGEARIAHIVFRDHAGGDEFYLRRESPGVYSDWAFPFDAFELLLDFDPVDETGYVLYQEASTHDLMLAWRTDIGDWTNTVALVTDYLPRLSFEMFDGTAHIAYTTSANEVMYYHFDPDGTSWGALIASAVGMQIPEPSLAVRSDGVPRISYDLDGVLYYAITTDMVLWTSNVVDDTGNDMGRYSSLALDDDDDPSISYQNNTDADLKYAYFNSFIPGWTTSTIDGATTISGELTSMALDPRTDYPRIAYRANDCAVCLSELVESGDWARTEITDGITYRRKVVVNSIGDVLILYHAQSAAGVQEVRLAVDNRRIFFGDFEIGSTVSWDQTVGAP